MLNQFRMDLYRTVRSKSTYVCLACMLVTIVLCYGMLWLVGTPQGQQVAQSIGMFDEEDIEEAGGMQAMNAELSSVLDGVDTLVMFRQSDMNGGMYSLVFGIWVILFVCMDYQSGFIKNILAHHENRWSYVGSKVLTAGLLNLVYLVLQLGFTILLNLLFGNMVPYTGVGSLLFYLSWVWLLTTAFAAMVILVSIWTRSVAAGTLTAVLIGGGLIPMAVYGILNNFHAAGWMKYTIYMSIQQGAGSYTSPADLYVYGVGAGFLLLYTVIAGLVLRRQDI